LLVTKKLLNTYQEMAGFEICVFGAKFLCSETGVLFNEENNSCFKTTNLT